MGWKAPTNPLHANLGEIPGLRELSEEEEAIMDENAPDRDDQNTIRKNATAFEEKTSEGLIDDFGQVAMDIGNILDTWENDATTVPVFNIMSETLFDDIETRLSSISSAFSAGDVYEIACKRTLKPYMFYYGINMDDSVPEGFVVVVTSIVGWEETKKLDDSDIADYVIPDFLTGLQESTYRADGMSPAKAKREMVKHGFEVKHEVAGL